MTLVVRSQTQKRNTTKVSEIPEPKARDIPKQDLIDAKESSKYLKYKAYEEAMRDFEQGRARVLAISHR